MKKPQLFVVATPIGNKNDLSTRAIETLKEVDVIACEDSRVSKKLLDTYGIDTKLLSYHKFNEKQRTQEIVRIIEEGKKIALISDAGTPCISDPGRILVSELFEKGIEITSIPGACAVITFLSQIPRNSEEFAFVGFLPRVKTQQRNIFQKYNNTDMVFYESANRLIETLENIKEERGKDAKAAIGRELTKMFEETITGTTDEIIEHYKSSTLKGEVVVMLYAQETTDESESEIIADIKKLKSAGYSDKDISIILATIKDYNKNKVYKLSLNTD